MIEWLPSIVEAKQWPEKLGKQLGDASVEAAASEEVSAAAFGSGEKSQGKSLGSTLVNKS